METLLPGGRGRKGERISERDADRVTEAFIQIDGQDVFLLIEAVVKKSKCVCVCD